MDTEMNPIDELLTIVYRQMYSTRIADAFAFVAIGLILGWLI